MRYKFGIFEADTAIGELTRQGKRIPVQDQPFRLLVLLLQRPGELVTREELRTELWPQTVVDFDHGVNKAVSKIRDALGDSAESPRYVETVARRGYRFLADVAVIGDRPADAATALVAGSPSAAPGLASISPASDASSPPFVEPAATPQHPRTTHWRLVAGIAAIAVIGILAWAWSAHRPTAPTIHSIAVLPLENISNDPAQDYFADGMTDELITTLAQVHSLRVISRTSVMTYKTAHKPLAEIARELNVQAVVEGTVFRSGDQVRITAQLIRAPADEHLWAQTYAGDLRDALTLQSQVARAIVTRIQTTLSDSENAALNHTKPVNPRAYEAYLKGRYFWSKRTGEALSKAIEYFNAAIAADPTYADAYSGLADAYALSGDWEYAVLPPQEAFARAREAATKAIELDPSSGSAHTSLAFALDLYGWDWTAAEAEHQRAIELNPGYATAHHWYAFHLLVLGRNSEGLFELRKAENLDPLSLIISADVADALCIAHLYDESIEESHRTLEMDPNFAVAHYELGQALTQKGQYAEAIAEFQRAIELSGHSGAFDSNLAYAYARAGRREEALAIVKDLEKRHEPALDSNIALAYVGLGDKDQAIAWLKMAFEARFNPSILMRPAFDPLRGDWRFQNIRALIGLSGS